MSPPELSGHPANSSRSPNKALPGAPSIAQFAMGGNEAISQRRPLSFAFQFAVARFAVILVSLKERQ
jgi:hypothetical protein